VPSTTLVNVVDTTPPSLNVVLLRTVLWPADHRLVRRIEVPEGGRRIRP